MSTEGQEIPISASHPQAARQLRLMTGLASILLAIGLVTPIVTLKQLLLFETTFSVVSGVVQLLTEGQWFLFLLISGFSIAIPVLKLSLLYRLVSSRQISGDRLHRYLHWMHVYGKWSMLDVFVVAVLVVVVKLGAIASVQMEPGLYAFAASVLLTMFVTARIVGLINRTS